MPSSVRGQGSGKAPLQKDWGGRASSVEGRRKRGRERIQQSTKATNHSEGGDRGWVGGAGTGSMDSNNPYPELKRKKSRHNSFVDLSPLACFLLQYSPKEFKLAVYI